jgi:hypothetical protein
MSLRLSIIDSIFAMLGARGGEDSANTTRRMPESVPEKWQIPDDLARAAIPRKLRLRATGWFLLGFGLCFMAFGAMGGVTAYLVRAQYETLISQGVETEANVTQIRQYRTRGGAINYAVSYSFVADAHVFSDTSLFNGSAYTYVRGYQQTPLLYLPSKPSVHRLLAEQLPPTFLTISPAVLPFAGLGLFAMWAVWRVWRLLSKGHIARAVVTGSRPSRNGLRLNYRFLDEAGREHIGRSNFDVSVAPPMIPVFYDPQNPRRNTLYPNPVAGVIGKQGAFVEAEPAKPLKPYI